MPDLEALGDAAMGAGLARAVEPRAGEGDDGHTHETSCLNCGAELAGEYCHACGQHAHVHRSLSAFWHDLAHSVLHFEGKIWRTLPLLAVHPGDLTRRYIEGERAKFVSPLALFLFSVFLMFAVFGLLGSPMDFTSGTPAQDRAEALRDLEEEQTDARLEIRGLEKELAEARAAGRETAGIEGRIHGVRTELEMRERASELALRLANEEEQRRTAGGAEAQNEPEVNMLSETGWKPLDEAVAKAEKNPSLLLYKIQANAYKFSWALIPISLPFVWMLFLHRRRYRREYGAYDHLVFVTYSIAFMSMLAIALSLLGAVGATAVSGIAFVLVPPIHMYRQLRGAYRLSRWSGLWRTFVLLIASFVTLSLFLTLLLAVGVFG